MNRFKQPCASVLLACAFVMTTSAFADTAVDTEIQSLIERVEVSQCVFHRNGSEYSAEKAAEHLRLKLSRGGKYAKSAELFIENLASKSSWSGKPYFIDCPSQEKQPSKDWFHQELVKLRAHG